MTIVVFVTCLRVVAVTMVSALVMALFLGGPVDPLLPSLIPQWGPVWVRVFLFLLLVGTGTLASYRDHRRLLVIFVSLSILLVIPSVYPFNSIDWANLLTGSSFVTEQPTSQVVFSLELVLLSLSLLLVFYLGWLRGVVTEGELQGVSTEDLHVLVRRSLWYVGVLFGSAGLCGFATAFLMEKASTSLLTMVEGFPMYVPILSMGACLVLAAALFSGLLQRPQAGRGTGKKLTDSVDSRPSL